MKATELKKGDKCPNCGGELKPAKTLTAEEYRKTYDRENPLPVSRMTDTASPEQRAELGDLYLCENGDYRARFGPEKSAGQGQGQAPAA